ncbi:MAG: 16S rRNA (uracil(1498)-N(3))-methyltransferase [Rikenellaceae bacterium]|nr:16S rRNA (uracil(1498)-N(3))-methyltransferase [Rikenellaceae bacterium]
MQLFYSPEITATRFFLSEEESKHCVRVLRLVEGDLIHLTDGRGSLHSARILAATPKKCQVQIVETIPEFGKLPYRLTLAVAPTKNNDRFEWFLEKATEIGIDRIIPIECDRSERRVYKMERGKKVIESAMKQSLKAYLPRLDTLTDLDYLLGKQLAGDKFIAHCQPAAEKSRLQDVLRPGQPALILIGPEGDFSPQEIQAAREKGFREISLGNSRLRTETAALVACHTVALINEIKPHDNQ